MSAPEERPEDARTGTTVAGRYFVHRRLGVGGMGEVYEATELAADRRVALKVLEPAQVSDPSRARRFEREAALARSLSHPACIEVLDTGRTADGALWIAMELVPGRDLARVLVEDGPMPPAAAAAVADQILAVLEEAHALGIVHRDLKPSNVMLDATREGEGAVKVLDFGIAALSGAEGEERLTRHGAVYGTPAYMSPEQVRGEAVDGRSDLYAVGAMLFEMLAGAAPFEAPTPLALAARKLGEPAPPLATRRSGVPPALAALVAGALERDPGARPANATAMRAELSAALPGAFSSARLGAPRRTLPPTEALDGAALAGAAARARRGRRSRLVFAAAALSAVTAALPLAWRRPAPREAQRAEVAAPRGAPPASEPPAPAPPAGTPAAPSAVALQASPAALVPAPAQRVPRRPLSGSEAAPPRAPPPPPIRLVRGELNAIPTPAAATGDGVLVLQAAPWAEVTVDGAALGETPREVRLGAGTYTVRAVHPELGAKEERVAIRPGERTLWVATFGE